jgi:hypothetical protein
MLISYLLRHSSLHIGHASVMHICTGRPFADASGHAAPWGSNNDGPYLHPPKTVHQVLPKLPPWCFTSLSG